MGRKRFLKKQQFQLNYLLNWPNASIHFFQNKYGNREFPEHVVYDLHFKVNFNVIVVSSYDLCCFDAYTHIILCDLTAKFWVLTLNNILTETFCITNNCFFFRIN